MPLISEGARAPREPHRQWGRVLAVAAMILMVTGGGAVAFLWSATDPVNVGPFSVIGPSWSSGGGIAYTERWEIGPFSIVRVPR